MEIVDYVNEVLNEVEVVLNDDLRNDVLCKVVRGGWSSLLCIVKRWLWV